MNSDDVQVEEVATVSQSSLYSLPIELFLIICDYVDANTLIRSLMRVNKHFYNIIKDNYLWKKRYMRKFNDCDVAFVLTKSYNENTFNWKKFAWQTELEEDCWSKHETNTTTSILKGVHFSEVDAVILTKDGDHCVSASRDRSLCLWNIMGENSFTKHKIDSHAGWIWDLEVYDENHFLSGSWDSSVKLWNTNNFSQSFDPVQTFSTDAAVISVCSKENFIAAGLYTPQIIAFDPREGDKRLFELRPQSRSIVALCLVQDYYLISLSEDRTLSVWDSRSHETIKKMLLTKGIYRNRCRFPMCASYYDNVLFVGDNRDHMYWLDCSHGSFDILKTVKIGKPVNDDQRSYKLNCIKCTNYGSIITGGNEGAIYILAPTNPPKVIARIADSGSEITSIDYQNDTLVAGYVNSEVQVWKKI